MEECTLRYEPGDGTYTVVLGKEKRPASPEPASSPCSSLHTITPLGAKEGWQGRPTEDVVVRAVHCCTPLNAAVIMGDITKVNAILQAGPSREILHNEDCSGSPAICEAAYHNQIEAMESLLKYGLNVNTVNRLGLTPVCISAGNYMDNPRMTNLLLTHNANINICAKDGRSPLHIAAEGGHLRIVKTLLASNKLHLETILQPFEDGDIHLPPPLILGAANHHYLVVDALLKHTSYPPGLQSDIQLVYWACSVLSMIKKGQHPTADTFKKLKSALQLRNDKDLVSAVPIATYCNMAEVCTDKDVNELAQLQAKDPSTCIFQSLVILERNIGLSNKLIGTYIEKAIECLCQLRKYSQVEQLLQRVFHGMPLIEQQMINREVYMRPSHLHVTLSFFLVNKFWDVIRDLNVHSHTIDYIPYIRELMGVLDIVLALKAKQSCQHLDHWGEGFQNSFAHLLALYSCALHSCNKAVSNRRVLNDLGCDLVEAYADYTKEHFTSLFHFTLRKASAIVEIIKFSGIGARNAVSSYIQLIEALLLWGSGNDINTPYKQFFCKGECPLHMAVRLAEMDPCYLPIVNFLFIHGAHYDGLSTSRITPMELATRPPLQACFDLSPLPLVCLVSKVIVDSGIEYWDNPSLPPVIKRFINYHDQIDRSY